MHGRTRAALFAIVAVCALPAPALAAQMPAGVYDTQLTGGTVKLGTLPSLPVPPSPSFPLTIGTSPLSAQANGFSIPAQPFDLNTGIGTVSGSYAITVQSLAISLDPSTGAATIDTGFYGTVTVTSPLSGTCAVASAGSPIVLHLSTAGGSAWDATTNTMSLVDKTFTLPSLSCPDPSLSLVASSLAAVIGGTTPGDNALTFIWSLIRRPDTTQGQSGGGSTGGTGGSGGTQQQSGGQTTPGATNPGSNATGCVVPKLKGKRVASRKALAKLKAQLRKAGCRLGKVKRVKSKKRKGLVIKQSAKPGKKLPAGTRVTVTVARGR